MVCNNKFYIFAFAMHWTKKIILIYMAANVQSQQGVYFNIRISSLECLNSNSKNKTWLSSCTSLNKYDDFKIYQHLISSNHIFLRSSQHFKYRTLSVNKWSSFLKSCNIDKASGFIKRPLARNLSVVKKTATGVASTDWIKRWQDKYSLYNGTDWILTQGESDVGYLN